MLQSPSTANTLNHVSMSGPNIAPHSRRALGLQSEERDEAYDRDDFDIRVKYGRGDAEPLERAEHCDGGGDHAVGVQKRGAAQP